MMDVCAQMWTNSMTDYQAARANLQTILRTALLAVPLLMKTEGAMDRHLWAASLEMFRTGDLSGFLDVFVDDIRNQLTRAFNEGARDVGMDPGEFTADDRQHLEIWIQSEYEHVLNLAQAIQDLHMSGVTLAEFRDAIRWRIELWANRYNEVVNEARVWFGGKTRLIWVLGETEEHCPSCSALAGIVAFAEEWDQSGYRPQQPPNRMLACEGWRCHCRLSPTEQRRSPNALNRLLQMGVFG